MNEKIDICRKSQNRRKFVGGLAASGVVGAVSTWHKPIIRTVVMPSHATTSYQCTIVHVTDTSDSVLMQITPPPALGTAVGGNYIVKGNQGSEIIRSYVPVTTTQNGSAILSELVSSGGSGSFVSDELFLGIVVEGFCLNPEQCNASCESDLIILD
jgi:hypothetical protein